MGLSRWCKALLAVGFALAGAARAQDPAHVQRYRDAVAAADAAQARLDAATAQAARAATQHTELLNTKKAAEERLALWENRYAGKSPLGIPTPEEAQELLARLERTTQAAARASERSKLQAERASVIAALERTRTNLSDLEQRLLADEQAFERELRTWAGAQGQDPEPLWDIERDRWAELRTRHLHTVNLIASELTGANEVLANAAKTDDELYGVRLKTVALIRRENLLLRGRNHIGWDSVTTGIADLARSPAWVFARVGDAGDYASDPAHRGALGGWALGSLLLMGVLALAARWIRNRVRALGAADSPQRGARATLLVGRVLRVACVAGMLSTPALLAAGVLPELGAAATTALATLGWGLGGTWFAVRAATVLLRPRPPAHPAGELDPAIATALWWRLVALASLTASWGVVRVLAGVAAYDNQGVLQLFDLAFAVLAGGVVISGAVQHRLFEAFAPEGSGAAAGLGRGLTSIARPGLLVLVPTVVVLLMLRLDLLARALAFGVAALATVGLAAWLILHAGGFALERWAARSSADARTRARRAAVLVRTGRFVLRLLVGLGAVWALAAMAGLTLDDVRRLFEVPLPLQSGEEPITWWNLILAGLVLIIGIPAARIAEESLRELVLRRTSIEHGLQYTVTTLTRYTIVLLAVYLALREVFHLEQLGYVVAALSVGIGFGLQEVVSNFVSGLILLFERPFNVGDTVRVGDTEGYVRKINIRATIIHTFDNIALMVPNKDFIAQSVVNIRHVDPKVRMSVKVGVSYGSDVDQVRDLLLQVADAHPRVLKEPPPKAMFVAFGDSSLDFELRVWFPDPDDRLSVPSDLRFAIVRAFREHGVEIPFPQRDLHLRSVAPGTLRPDDSAPMPPAAPADPEPPPAAPSA